MFHRLTVFVLTVLVFSAAAWAQQDPFNGTWKQNIAKSKYNPGPPPSSPSVTKIEAAPGGAVKVTTDGVDAQGSKTHTEYTAKYDGKDYPYAGSPDWDTVAVRRIDTNTRLTVNKKNGSVTRMILSVVSPDGKTRTNTTISVNARGQAAHNETIWDKQ